MAIFLNYFVDHSTGLLSLILTTLLDFACFYFECQQKWLQWRRGGGTLFCTYDYTYFVQFCEIYYGHSNIAFARRVGEACNFELGYESIGHRERIIWNQEQRFGFL